MNNATLSALKVFPDQLEAHYFAIPQGLSHWSPPSWDGIPSESLTAIEHLCHIRDVEVEGYHLRFRRMLEETNPTLVSLDAAALAKARRYGNSDPHAVLAAFRQARANSIGLLTCLSHEQLARRGIFENYGSVSLASLAHYLCSHDQQHLAGLQWLLGKITSTGVG